MQKSELHDASFGSSALGQQPAISYCGSHKDFISRDLFVSSRESKEEHVNWLGIQNGLLEQSLAQTYSNVLNRCRGAHGAGIALLPSNRLAQDPVGPELTIRSKCANADIHVQVARCGTLDIGIEQTVPHA